MTLHYPALVHVLCRARGRVRSSQKATLGAQRLLMVGLALTLLLASTRALSSSTLYSNARSILEHFKGSAQQDDARLGVRRVQLYVKIPTERDGKNITTTALATLWLRRVGGDQAGPYALPHQAQDAIRGFLWLDDPDDLRLRGPCSHLKLPIPSYAAWEPQLQLEAGTGQVLRAHVHTEPQRDGTYSDPIRPISFRIELPPNAGTCFKIYEESYLEHKAAVCLQPSPRLCAQLAPPEAHTAATPALWAVVGPVRDYAVTNAEWDKHSRRTAFLVHRYLSYHLAAGVSGLLLYADSLGRAMLQKEPLLAPYLKDRTLRLIRWEMIERKDPGGSVEYNGYNYDQALHSSHAMLGASACGANLQLLLTDLDEYLYLPRGRPWPEPHAACLAPEAGEQQQGAGAGGAGVTAMSVLLRRNVHASSVKPEDEPALWTARPPNPQPGGGPAAELRDHPLALYDMVAREALPWMHGKRIVLPAAEVIAFFVHEGFPLYGETRTTDLSCVSILHVAHMVRTRGEVVAAAFEPLTNWLLPPPAEAAGQSVAQN